VLSGTVSTAADIFSLGMAALELVSDYDMPVTGDLWTDIRGANLPTEIISGTEGKLNVEPTSSCFFTVLTDRLLKELLLRMIHADYKLRPSAKEVLDSPTIRDQVSDRE
jgi:serine/threonine protein kinase